MPRVTDIANAETPSTTRAQRLRHLDVELTERCQNACRHCCINRPVGDRAARQRELATSTWIQLFQQAVALGMLSIRFTGGEPLLRDDFSELYLCVRRLGVKVMLFTNARAITPELAELFHKIPPLDKIEVSVYGMTPASYEAVSGARGSYDEFQRGVALLREYNIPFIVKGAILPQNRHEIAAFDTWAATIPWMKHMPSYAMFFEYRARRDSPAANRRIDTYRLSPEEGIAILRRDHDYYDAEMATFCATHLGVQGDTLFSCGAAKGGVCIDAYGWLQPCLSMRHPDWTYNLQHGSLADGLCMLQERIKGARAQNPAYLARCARCFLKALCLQCPAKSWMEYGTTDTPVEYLCQVTHVQARDLGLLKTGECAWEIDEAGAKQRILQLQGVHHETSHP